MCKNIKSIKSLRILRAKKKRKEKYSINVNYNLEKKYYQHNFFHFLNL